MFERIFFNIATGHEDPLSSVYIVRSTKDMTMDKTVTGIYTITGVLTHMESFIVNGIR